MMNLLGWKEFVVEDQKEEEEGDKMNGDEKKKGGRRRRSWEEEGWAERVLGECARAIAEGDTGRTQQLLWMLNELASPYGDTQQKLASYFLQPLLCKATRSSIPHTSTSASTSFDSARRLILRFQEVSPWTTFGHVASNGAILEALDGHPRLHIVDIMSSPHLLCTQWPTLLEALATRSHDTPHLNLTLLLLHPTTGLIGEVRQRMEKFARLMGVPFHLNITTMPHLNLNLNLNLTKEALRLEEGEALAVNCVGALRGVRLEDRAALIAMLSSLNPKVVTLVEEEADMCSTRGDFVNAFDECLRFSSLYFDALDQSFGPTSNERLMLERHCSRSILRVLASSHDHHHHHHEPSSPPERRERGRQWGERMKQQFRALPFSDDVLDDVKALLRRYSHGWSLSPPDDDDGGIYLHWKDHPVVWASAWKP